MSSPRPVAVSGVESTPSTVPWFAWAAIMGLGALIFYGTLRAPRRRS